LRCMALAFAHTRMRSLHLTNDATSDRHVCTMSRSCRRCRRAKARVDSRSWNALGGGMKTCGKKERKKESC
jgi:hypothetical protein